MRIAFVFPGQGSQYQGMGIDFCDNFDSAKKIFDIASDIIKLDLYSICKKGSEEELKNTEITQPATVCVSIAILESVKEKYNFSSEVTAGHSVGEISSLICAGVIDLSTGIEIISRRAKFMQESANLYPNCTMAAIIGLDLNVIKETCEQLSSEGIIQVANLNSPLQTIISGEGHLVKKAMEKLSVLGAKKTVQLSVSGAWHSRIMRPAHEKLKAYIEPLNFHKPEIKFIPNVTGRYENEPANIKKFLIEQVISPVLWTDSINLMINHGIDTFIELGPGRVLSGLIRRINRDVKVVNVSRIDDLSQLTILN